MKQVIAKILIALLATVSITAISQSDSTSIDMNNQSQTIFSNDIYNSSRYTNVDDLSQVSIQNHLDEGFELVATDDKNSLFFQEENYIFAVKDEQSNYIWYSSALDLENSNLNSTLKKQMKTPILVNYYPYSKSKEQVLTTVKKLTIYDAEVTIENIDLGLKLHLDFGGFNIRLDLLVYLEEQSLKVEVPFDQIVEETHLIESIQVFHNYGSTRSNDIPGYFVIPDGIGALYRFKNNDNLIVSQLNVPFYGNDIGLNEQNSQTILSMPMYGIVQGINQYGTRIVIEQGAANADLIINPSGANNNEYNWMGTKFQYRSSLVYPVNLKGDGTIEVTPLLNHESIKLNFELLSKDDANYIGIAKDYQNYLINHNQIKLNETKTSMIIEILVSDSQQGLFGYTNKVFTTTEEIKHIINEFQQNNFKNITFVLQGWNKGGLSGETPYKVKFENKSIKKIDYDELYDYASQLGYQLTYTNDYVQAYETSNQKINQNDYAKAINSILIEKIDEMRILYPNSYYLNAKASHDLMLDDLDDYKKNQINSLALSTVGTTLKTTYDNQLLTTRNDEILLLLESMEAYKQDNIDLNFYQPNMYLWAYTSRYLSTPMYHSQNTIYDDTIPLLTTVLRNEIPLFSTHVNQLSNINEQKLNMLDYGIQPSYIVTMAQSSDLKYTESREFLSTDFNVWKETIIDDYHEFAEVLDTIGDADIVARTVISQGVVKITYSNQSYIYINYTHEDVTIDSIVVGAQDYEVGELT